MRLAAVAAALLAAAPPLAAGQAADCPKALVDKPPAGVRESPAARAEREDLEMVLNVVAGYESCSRDAAGFAKEYGPVYREWRERFRDAIARFDRNPRARRYLECGLEHERRRMAAESAAGKAEKNQTCHGLVGPGIENIARRP